MELKSVSHLKKSDEGNSTRYPTMYLTFTMSYFQGQGIESQRGEVTFLGLHSKLSGKAGLQSRLAWIFPLSRSKAWNQAPNKSHVISFSPLCVVLQCLS